MDILFKKERPIQVILFVCAWCVVVTYIQIENASKNDTLWETVLSYIFPLFGFFAFYHIVIKAFFKERISITSDAFTYYKPIIRDEVILEMNHISDLRKSIHSTGYFTFRYRDKEVHFGDDISKEDGEEVHKIILANFPYMAKRKNVSEKERKLEDEVWDS